MTPRYICGACRYGPVTRQTMIRHLMTWQPWRHSVPALTREQAARAITITRQTTTPQEATP